MNNFHFIRARYIIDKKPQPQPSGSSYPALTSQLKCLDKKEIEPDFEKTGPSVFFVLKDSIF